VRQRCGKGRGTEERAAYSPRERERFCTARGGGEEIERFLSGGIARALGRWPRHLVNAGVVGADSTRRTARSR
jgi:hypothetical protein